MTRDRPTETDARTEAGADSTPGTRPATDGGDAAAGADAVALDPWGSSTVSDYRKLFEEFGIEEFDDALPEVPEPHYLMRRGVIFGHRDYRPIAAAMRDGGEFAVLSGFMPTGDPHVGHKLVFDEIIWHQERGADAYGLIADLEAHSARGLPWDEIDEHARDYLLSLLALGFDADEGTLYRQSDNRELQDLAFELGSKARFSEFEAIYGFDGETSVSHMQSVVTQMADILYPQLDGPKPTVIPVGPDQDPHVRLARDLAAKMRFFKVTEAYASFEADALERDVIAEAHRTLSVEASGGSEASEGPGERGGTDSVRCEDAAAWLESGEFDRSRLESDGVGVSEAVVESAVSKLDAAGKEPLRPRVRFLDRNATESAFEALIDAVEGEKRVFEGHVDAFDLSREAAEELAREVEIDEGGYGFLPPSSIYHRFMTGLTGGKMSSSVPASHISLLDDPEDGYDKVKSATTGGRETAELQRELGGEADKCPVYELYAYLLAGDDDEFAKEVYDECVGGERLCGDCKEQAARLMREFLEDHREKREEAEAVLADLDIDLDSNRRGVAGE
ncbi:tryptophan--tRNA ligase [Halegenticoccus tardaugens]|uniref:tryptophan--tRNA ligase n=1 Tax=Halegenticoccus tardaugens TaxID=2071624 RepID=UPI00100C2529|nr:tryptophan--tRNA ligase [Halegenticoccus tardaugens]